MSDVDMVNQPPHYKDASGIECIEVTKFMQFCGGNCFKYLYRAGQKGCAIEDLKKAAWYADMAFDSREGMPQEAASHIREIARNREGFIFQAMMSVRWGDWQKVEGYIQDEIERLESIGGDE